MPRIISGSARGIQLDNLKGKKTRPTSDRAKEALYSILSDRFIGGKVLDLYSGTGALGLEALSRGADFCLFIEKERKAIEIINRNRKKTKLENKSKVMCADVIKALDTVGVIDEQYMCIFMDPPYNRQLVAVTIEKIGGNDIMGKNSVLVVEHSDEEIPPKETEDLICEDRRCYGAVNFSFYVRKTN